MIFFKMRWLFSICSWSVSFLSQVVFSEPTKKKVYGDAKFQKDIEKINALIGSTDDLVSTKKSKVDGAQKAVDSQASTKPVENIVLRDPELSTIYKGRIPQECNSMLASLMYSPLFMDNMQNIERSFEGIFGLGANNALRFGWEDASGVERLLSLLSQAEAAEEQTKQEYDFYLKNFVERQNAVVERKIPNIWIDFGEENFYPYEELKKEIPCLKLLSSTLKLLLFEIPRKTFLKSSERDTDSWQGQIENENFIKNSNREKSSNPAKFLCSSDNCGQIAELDDFITRRKIAEEDGTNSPSEQTDSNANSKISVSLIYISTVEQLVKSISFEKYDFSVFQFLYNFLSRKYLSWETMNRCVHEYNMRNLQKDRFLYKFDKSMCGSRDNFLYSVAADLIRKKVFENWIENLSLALGNNDKITNDEDSKTDSEKIKVNIAASLNAFLYSGEKFSMKDLGLKNKMAVAEAGKVVKENDLSVVFASYGFMFLSYLSRRKRLGNFRTCVFKAAVEHLNTVNANIYTENTENYSSDFKNLFAQIFDNFDETANSNSQTSKLIDVTLDYSICGLTSTGTNSAILETCCSELSETKTGSKIHLASLWHAYSTKTRQHKLIGSESGNRGKNASLIRGDTLVFGMPGNHEDDEISEKQRKSMPSILAITDWLFDFLAESLEMKGNGSKEKEWRSNEESEKILVNANSNANRDDSNPTPFILKLAQSQDLAKFKLIVEFLADIVTKSTTDDSFSEEKIEKRKLLNNLLETPFFAILADLSQPTEIKDVQICTDSRDWRVDYPVPKREIDSAAFNEYRNLVQDEDLLDKQKKDEETFLQFQQALHCRGNFLRLMKEFAEEQDEKNKPSNKSGPEINSFEIDYFFEIGGFEGSCILALMSQNWVKKGILAVDASQSGTAGLDRSLVKLKEQGKVASDFLTRVDAHYLSELEAGYYKHVVEEEDLKNSSTANSEIASSTITNSSSKELTQLQNLKSALTSEKELKSAMPVGSDAEGGPNYWIRRQKENSNWRRCHDEEQISGNSNCVYQTNADDYLRKHLVDKNKKKLNSIPLDLQSFLKSNSLAIRMHVCGAQTKVLRGMEQTLKYAKIVVVDMQIMNCGDKPVDHAKCLYEVMDALTELGGFHDLDISVFEDSRRVLGKKEDLDLNISVEKQIDFLDTLHIWAVRGNGIKNRGLGEKSVFSEVLNRKVNRKNRVLSSYGLSY